MDLGPSLVGRSATSPEGQDPPCSSHLLFGMEDPMLPSTVAGGPSQFWRVAGRRERKSGSPNIFRDVNLRQLQRLFQRAGDRDAEQRAQLVWGHGDAAELAQALIALRARGRRSRLRGDAARDTQGPRWLRAFGHLKINEASMVTADDEDSVEVEPSPLGGPETAQGGVAEDQVDKPLVEGCIDSERLQKSPVGSLWSRQGALSTRERDPERYLHRILH
ncbi:hypothetical protein AGOR_G00201780 [Albula goreensis]|uniref:Arginine vasopressin-induced protein 1 n=1 Tax=Albula goreensis TaxID=1534307 RepID=A0A8T3CUT1_9TELE|nr:hypothetical protein AGOR_G00201780 [Albula goreensis]